MQEYFRNYRPLLMGNQWMVTADHPLAVQAAGSILDEGGDAVEALVLANLVMAVVNPHMCGLGGDLFAIHADACLPHTLQQTDHARRMAICPAAVTSASTMPGSSAE